MARWICCVGLCLFAAAAWAQTDGRPLRPQTAYAYIYNNTDREIRYAVSSARGTSSGRVRPGRYGAFPFSNDGRPRVLSTFFTDDGEIVSNRFPNLQPNYVYDAAFNDAAYTVQATEAPAAEPGAEAPPAKDDGREMAPPAHLIDRSEN